MNPKVKKIWLKALRTPADEGGYLQCKGKLHDGSAWFDGAPADSFCCLGVLTNLAVLAGVVIDEDPWCTPDEAEERQVDLGMPTASVLVWAGIGSGHEALDGESLPTRNDSGMSFTEIADLIEKHL